MPDDPQTLAYFQARMRESDRLEWEHGARLTEEWIALIDRAGVVESEFRALLARLEEPVDPPGSAWFDLWLRVRHWGYERGFSIPDDHPWRGYPATATCIDHGEYTQQLTAGKHYVLCGRRADDDLIRVTNDQGRTRWYPSSLFEGPAVPDRLWTRK